MRKKSNRVGMRYNYRRKQQQNAEKKLKAEAKAHHEHIEQLNILVYG
jgi:hypothetical protein